ncbi:hypothetical protein SK128_007196 [Halocaridina rubra]|uniref:Uncharacterized protein n=1 Tax=Halocaridina rubra TaxID=373956 RepID=A0AAN8WKB7_HALRR
MKWRRITEFVLSLKPKISSFQGKETVSSVSNICHSYEVRGTASHNWTGKSRLIQNDVNDFCGFDSIDQIGENFSPKLYMYDDGKESYKDQVEKIDNENEIFCDYSKILQVIKHTPCSFEKDQICKINLSKFIVPYSSIQYREIQSVTIDNASIIFCEPLISNYFLPFATNDTPEHKEWTLISKVVVSGQESCNFITFKRSIVSKCEGLLEAASPERRLETVQPETGIRSNENSIVESTVCSLSFRDKGTSLCKNIQFDKVNRSLPVDSWYKSATLATSQLENQESSHKINGNLDMIKYLSGLENETSGIEMIRRIKIGNPESENEILELTCARNDHEGKEFIPFSSRATSLVNHSPSSTISSRLSGCSIFSVYPKSHVDVNDSVLNFQNKTSQENDSYKYEGHSSICTSRDEDKRSSSDGNILTFVKSHIPEFVYWKNSQQYEIEIEQEYPVIMSSLVLGANMLNSEVATRNCKKHFIENDNSLESKVFQSGICTSFLQKITQSEETHKRDESKRRETEIKQHKNEETYKKDKSKKRESEIKQQGKREANSCKERKAETSKSNTRKRENVSRKKEIRTKARENETKRRENRIKIKENDKKQKSVTEKRENETIIPKDEAKKIEGKSKINRQKRIRFQTERNYLKLQTPGIKAVTYWESRKDRDVDTLQNYNKEKNNVLNERKKGDSPEARKTTVIGKKKEENRVKKRVESNYNTGNEVNQREKYGINRISDLKRKKINETLIGTIEGSGALERRKIESIPIRDICKRGPHKIQCREREDKHIRKCFNVKSKMSKAQENCAKKYHDYNAHERKTGIVRKIYKGEKNKGKKIVFNTKEKSGHSTKTLEGFLLVKREESKHRRAEHNIQKKGKCENTAAKKPYAVNNETQTIKMGISDTSGKNKHDKYETTQTDNIRKRKSYEYSCKEDCPSKKRKIRSLEGERNGRSENCKVTEKVSDRKEKGHTEKEEENTVHSVVSTEYPFSDAVISNLEEPFDINDIPPTDEMKYDTLIEDRIQEKSKLFETKSMISHLNNRNSASLRKTYSCSKHKKRKILNSRYMKSKSREQNIYAKDNSARNKTTDFIIAKPDHVCTTKPASTNCKRRMRSYPKSVHWFDDVSSLNSNNKSIVCSKKKKNVSKSKSILKKRNYQEGLFSYHSDQKSQDNTDTNCPENQSTSTIIKKPTDRKNPKFFKSKFALESYISSLTCTSSAKCIPPQFFTRSKSFELLKHRYPPYTHGRDEERLNSCSNIPGISDVNNSSHPSLDTLQHEVLHPLIDNSPDWISPFHKDKLSRRSQELYDIFSEMDSHIKVPYKLFKMYRRKQSDAFKLSDSYCANCRKGFNQDLSAHPLELHIRREGQATQK